jgi:hypothetical protein
MLISAGLWCARFRFAEMSAAQAAAAEAEECMPGRLPR